MSCNTVYETDIRSPSVPPEFVRALVSTVRGNRTVFQIDGRPVAMNPTWLRDHVHEMKGYKYWETDVRSGLDHFLTRQQPSGFLYEMIVPIDNVHTTFVRPDCLELDEKNGLAYVRLEIEADVEYLTVEGVWQAWQASGDDDWMRAHLPRLVRALDYCFTDPKRWSPEYGLMKRAFTIDTWDYTYGVPDSNRCIEADTPMGIMHGDSTGLFWACNLLAEMLEYAGDAEQASDFRGRAAALRKHLDQYCWNGRFYTHMLHLSDIVVPGSPEENRLSLSNAYALNRGVLSLEQARSVIHEYQARREEHKATHFAEWFSIDPPYEKWMLHPPGHYINGGIAGFVAGELARGAFTHGEEAYGADILRRVRDKVAADGTLYFLMTADGEDMGGGPRGWGAAAVFAAIAEGVAGVVDRSKLFESVELAPRWPALGDREASVTLVYPAGGAFFAYEYRHDPAARRIAVNWRGSHTKRLHGRFLLPTDAHQPRVRADGEAVHASLLRVADSPYADFALALPTPSSERTREIEVTY